MKGNPVIDLRKYKMKKIRQWVKMNWSSAQNDFVQNISYTVTYNGR